jgi:hypothetical protein
MSSGPGDKLDRARQDAALSHTDLFVRYFELGGMSSAVELEAFCYGMLQPTPHDYDVLAQALNERFSELGLYYPVAYSDRELPEELPDKGRGSPEAQAKRSLSGPSI